MRSLVVLFVLAVVSIAMFTGCSQSIKPDPVQVKPDPIVPPFIPTLSIIKLDHDQFAGRVINPVARRGEVYFDTGSSSVSAQSVDTLRHLARFLRGHPDTLVRLIGNCDERGSFAYNQRLGADRAVAVAKVLEDNGIPSTRISTNSSGEFKPMLRCHAEKCWKMNRRVDVVYGW